MALGFGIGFGFGASEAPGAAVAFEGILAAGAVETLGLGEGAGDGSSLV